MKNLIISFLISYCTFLITQGGMAQGCLPEGIEFSQQADIDNFQTNYPGCTEIEGNVTIELGNINNLNGLIILKSIVGSLKISGSYSSDITHLSGLDSLASIGGDLSITKTRLTHLFGLENLSYIGGNIVIHGNNYLISLTGLEGLTSIAGSILLCGWNGDALEGNSLIRLSGLDNLTSIGGDLSIARNNVLTNLTGLGNLQTVHNLQIGNFSEGNLFLASLEGLESLTNITGELFIFKNSNLSSLSGLESLSSIAGNLYISNNPDLISLSGMASLDSVGGDMSINNFNLSSLEGLESLTSVGGTVSISNTGSLNSLTGLENLTTIAGSLYLTYNYGLVSLTGLESLSTIGGSIGIDHNNALFSLAGLESLIYIANLYISENNSLTSLTGLNNLISIATSLWISDNDALTSLAGLDNLDSIGSNLSIINNQILSSCEAEGLCEYLSNLAGPIDIYGNAEGCRNPGQVAAACGIDPFCLPYGNYYFHSQNDIDEFPSNYPDCYALEGLVEISGSNITNLDGLNAVTSIGGYLDIENNSALVNLTGLENMNYASGVFICGNPVLSSLTGLEGLTNIGNLTIGHVSWGSCGNPALTSLTGLENLSSVGNLFIQGNDTLKSLTGIDHLNPDSVGSLQVSHNPNLSICNNQFICDFIKDHNAEVGYNATGCNSVQEVLEACTFGIDESAVGSSQFAVHSFPNPTSGIVDLQFTVYNLQSICLKVYNAQGQEVVTLLDKKLPNGEHTVSWDAGALPAGVYYYRLTILRTSSSGQADDSRLTTGKLVKY